VVASQGHYDEEALQTILSCEVDYVGLVSSRARGATVKATLRDRGLSGLEQIHNPAGLDLGARTPPEVALSILAEIVQTAPAALQAPVASTPPPAATAIDPVCGMDVEIATARHKADVDDVTYYFCCASCQTSFVKEPQAFLSARG
jgi:xanthine dehydrogenase accessory factor